MKKEKKGKGPEKRIVRMGPSGRGKKFTMFKKKV